MFLAIMFAPLKCFLPCGLFHFLRPAFCPGTVLPPFNGFRTIFEAEYQGVVFLRSDCRYFIVKGIRAAQNFLSDGNERVFRDLLGWAAFFAHRIEGAADPHGAGLGDFSAVVLSAATTYHHSGERVCILLYTRVGMFVGSALNLLLHSVILSQRDDRFVAVSYCQLYGILVTRRYFAMCAW